MTKQEIKKAKEKIFSEYSQAVYLRTNFFSGETDILNEKMETIAITNIFDYIKKRNKER